MRSWIIRLLVPTFHSMCISFLNFLQHFVQNVFVTDDVLLSISAHELIEFKNKIDQIDYHQDQKAALDRLREEMLTLGISIIEHNDLSSEPIAMMSITFLGFNLKKRTRNS